MASNYEITQRRMESAFVGYDQDAMIRKFQLRHDTQYLYLRFLRRDYRIDRFSGAVEWSDDGFTTANAAGFNEAMTFYDLLCNAKENCRIAGSFVNMKSLSAIMGSSDTVGSGFYDRTAQLFDNRDEALSRACRLLGGVETGRGDVAYQIPLFDFLPVVFQFWNSDEEFPATIELFWDKNILDFMHYETVWYAASHLLERIREEMAKS